MTMRTTLFRSAAVVGLLGASARLAAAAAGILMAHKFGAGAATDAYLLAKTLPVGLYLILDSVLYNALVPIFRRDEEPASLFRASLWLAAAIGVLLAMALWLGAAVLISLLAPGADPATRLDAATLQHLSAWALLFAAPASCLKAWNASRDRYIAASLDSLLISGLLFAVLMLSPESAGVVPITIALPVAFAGLLAVQAWLARDVLGFVSPSLSLTDYPWRRLRRPVAPLLALNAAQQAQVWIVVMLAANFGAGSVSQVHYSYGIAQIPVGIIDLVLFSTLFPFAAGLAAQNDRARLAGAFRAAATALLLICVPLALWVALSRQIIVDALLLRGVFDAEDGRFTALLLLGHAVAIPGWCLEALGCRMLFALDRHAHYLGIVLLRLILFLLFSALLLPLLGLAGLSLAFAGAFTSSAAAVTLLVRKGLPAPPPGARLPWLRAAAILAGASGAIAGGTWAAKALLSAADFEHPLWLLAARCALAGAVLGGVLFTLWRQFGSIPERD